jgi:hypothetical protein
MFQDSVVQCKIAQFLMIDLRSTSSGKLPFDAFSAICTRENPKEN